MENASEDEIMREHSLFLRDLSFEPYYPSYKEALFNQIELNVLGFWSIDA
jgi:hypothetical protein